MNDLVERRRRDAAAIWQAGVDAVNSQRLVRERVACVDGGLVIEGHHYDLRPGSQILVVGAGKAGGGMAAGFEQALAGTPAAERLSGWINVPADCVRELPHLHLHAARSPGINEPTDAGVEGSREILRLVRGLSAGDLCVVLLSGGGSALLPAPIPEITLNDKQIVTRFLMSAGATIDELNCVRKHLSQIKGGKLARAAGSARVVALILSDVVGDPLDVIASGPTVADRTTAADAQAILSRFDSRRSTVPPSVWSALESQAREPRPAPLAENVFNLVIGNNATALAAAARKASELGSVVQSLGSDQRGVARDVGRELAEFVRSLRDRARAGERTCVLSGGEPVVKLAPTDRPRKGGRNQELVLAALHSLWDSGLDRMTILSGGTDGEDGPTDAAGAFADQNVLNEAKRLGLEPAPFLAINDSYSFFEKTGGLFKTGPTETNVMDLRVALIDGDPPKLAL